MGQRPRWISLRQNSQPAVYARFKVQEERGTGIAVLNWTGRLPEKNDIEYVHFARYEIFVSTISMSLFSRKSSSRGQQLLHSLEGLCLLRSHCQSFHAPVCCHLQSSHSQWETVPEGIFDSFQFRKKWYNQVYVSLMPIVAGVIIASATEMSFSTTALATALFSTGTYSLLNILVKKVPNLRFVVAN